MKSRKQAIVFDAITFCFLATMALFVALRPSEEQLLNMGQNSLIVALLFTASIGLSALLIKNNIRTWGLRIFGSPALFKGESSRPFFLQFSMWQIFVTFAVLFTVSVSVTEFSFTELFDERGFDGAMRLFSGLLHPNFAVLPRAILDIFQTIFIAFLATALAIPIAFVISFMCAKNVMKHPVAFAVYVVLRTALNIIRSVEPLIWAIIFSVWVGIGPFAGMLALFIHSIVSLAKQYSEMVETVSDGPIEGVLSTGARPLQVIWFGFVPQIVLPYISFTIYRWDINVRMATIIGLVGGGGIGTLLIKFQGQAMWPEVGCIIVVIAVVVWLLDAASAYLREAIK